MKKIIYYFWTLAAIFIFTSCGNDNYDAPAETFQGAFIDKDTNEPIQTAASTAIEHGGIRIRLMEYSWRACSSGSGYTDSALKCQSGAIPSRQTLPLSVIPIATHGYSH